MTQVRLIITVILLFLCGLLVWRVPEHYREQGRQEVEQRYKEAEQVAIVERNALIERLKVEHENTNRVIQADYEGKIAVLNERYIAAKRDGLRLPKSTCSGLTTSTETPSSSRGDEDQPIRLPSAVENGLFDLAKRADEVNAQLSACQTWIKQNGFYEHKP